jgi:hypothetical protein
VNRREFITLLGGAAVSWPLAVRAQQAGKVHRIGFLGRNPADDEYPDKPPRMRWATYNRLLDKLRAADGVVDERLRRVLINAHRVLGAKRNLPLDQSTTGLTQAVIRKHSLDLPMGSLTARRKRDIIPPLHE